jgi:hypothetical protein
MFTTEGLTTSTTPVTAREYASISRASADAFVDEGTATRGGSSPQAFTSDRFKAGKAETTSPDSSKSILHRCLSIFLRFIWQRARKKPEPKIWFRLELAGLPG